MLFCWCPPAPEKELPGFWLGKHLVTQAQWTGVGMENRSHFRQNSKQPVDSVSWHLTVEFAERTQSLMPPGYELWLPRDLEWCHACLAGDYSARIGIGAGQSLNSQLANSDGWQTAGGPGHIDWLNRGRTLEVGSFPPNAWGLHDMHGQLWEWTAEPIVGFPEDVRHLRGGSWADSLGQAQMDNWARADVSAAGNRIGFRVRPCKTSDRATLANFRYMTAPSTHGFR